MVYCLYKLLDISTSALMMLYHGSLYGLTPTRSHGSTGRCVLPSERGQLPKDLEIHVSTGTQVHSQKSNKNS